MTVKELKFALIGIPDEYEVKISDGDLRLNLEGVKKESERKYFLFDSGGWYTNHYCILNVEKIEEGRI